MREIDVLEQLARLSRKTEPPAMDVADAVLARLADKSKTSVNRPLAMIASISTIAAVIAMAVVIDVTSTRTDDGKSGVILTDLEQQMLAPIDLIEIARR